MQSHGDLKLITLSNHIVKVSSAVRSSETSVILLLSFGFFFLFFFLKVRYLTSFVPADPHVKLETFLSLRLRLQKNLNIPY